MDTFREQMCAAIPRATVALSLSLLVVAILVRVLQPPSPRWQRLAWLLVLLQGIVFLRFSLAIPCLPSEPVISANPLPTPPPPTTSPPRAFSFPASVRSPVPLPIEANGEPSDWRRVAFNAWLVGCGGVLGWWSVLYLIVLRESARAAAAPVAWTNEWTALLSEMGVRTRIPLQVTQNVGPVLCRGLRGHRVLVPHALWECLTSEERSAVLRHELAHFRRADPWQSLLIRLLALPHWFNPLAWFVVRKMDECAEWLCDDAATRSDNRSAEVFAQVLLRLGAEKRSQWIRMPGAAMRGGRLHGRIRRLLAPASHVRSTIKGLALAMTACGLLAAQMVRFDLVAAEQADANEPAKKAAAVKQPGAAKQSTLERILANWKARQERVRSFRFDSESQSTDPARRRLIESWMDGMSRYRSDRTMILSTGKARANRRIDLFTSLAVAENRFSWLSFWQVGTHPPSAEISKRRGYNPRESVVHIVPRALLLAFRPFDRDATGWRPEEFRVVNENASLRGSSSRYVTVQRATADGNLVDTCWVDPNQGDVVVRWEQRHHGRFGEQISIQYREDPNYGWIPAYWRLGYEPEETVTRFMINEKLPADIFAPDFPPGTHVVDEFSGTQYTVGTDLGKTNVVALNSDEAAIKKALERPADFVIEPQPLKDALAYISEKCLVRIILDDASLEKAAIDPSTEVKVENRGIKVGELLQIVLKQCHSPARFEIDDGALLITASKKPN